MSKTKIKINSRMGPLFGLIDLKDSDKISKYTWYLNDDGYALTSHYLGGGRLNSKIVKLRMHRLVIGAKKGQIVDHINQNKLDNRLVNLRIATPSQNAHNAKDREDNKSGHPGVYKRGSRYIAVIRIKGKREWLGTFLSQEEATRAYKKRKKQLKEWEAKWKN